MVRIKDFPYFNNPNVTSPLDCKGDSQYAPESDTGSPLVVSASSKRGDGEDSAYVHNLKYTAVQEFNWSFSYQGPPTPEFTTDVIDRPLNIITQRVQSKPLSVAALV